MKNREAIIAFAESLDSILAGPTTSNVVAALLDFAADANGTSIYRFIVDAQKFLKHGIDE